VLVTKPVTFRTPDRIEFATLLDIFVTLLALRMKTKSLATGRRDTKLITILIQRAKDTNQVKGR